MTRRDFWRTLILTSAVCLLPIAIGLCLWQVMPETIPVHWNAEGQPDGYASRAGAVFGMPMLFLAINLLGHVCLWLDPRSKQASRVLLDLGRWVSPIMSLLCMGISFTWAVGTEVNINRIVPASLGLLLIVIGNYLPKCRPNRTIGIRVPWTLRSDENWNRTHRFGGWVYLAIGLLMTVSGLCGFGTVVLCAVLPLAFLPILYSYMLYRRGI